MSGAEFVRRAKRYARKFGLSFRFDPSVGKGSHGRLHIGGRFTTVPRKGLLAAMLKDLGMDREVF